MKVIVTLNGKSRGVAEGIFLYSLPYKNRFLLKVSSNKISENIKKIGETYYASESLKNCTEVYEIINK